MKTVSILKIVLGGLYGLILVGNGLPTVIHEGFLVVSIYMVLDGFKDGIARHPRDAWAGEDQEKVAAMEAAKRGVRYDRLPSR